MAGQFDFHNYVIGEQGKVKFFMSEWFFVEYFAASIYLDFQVSFALDKNANDHTLACVRVLYRFYNSAGNALRHLLVANLAKDLGPEVPDCQAGIKLLENLDPLVTQLLASENRSIVALRNVWFTLSNNVFSFNYFIYWK